MYFWLYLKIVLICLLLRPHLNDPVANTVLLPGQTAAILAADSDLTVAALPVAY